MKKHEKLPNPTSEQDLKAWDWLKTLKAEAILELPWRSDRKRRCKVCDAWVEPANGDAHAEAHNRERTQMRAKARKEADKKRDQARALKAEANPKGRPE